jgi:hypothetical protein
MLNHYYPIETEYDAVFQQLPQQALTVEKVKMHLSSIKGEQANLLLNIAAFIQNKEEDIATFKEREAYIRQERQLAEQQVATLKKYCLHELQCCHLEQLDSELLTLRIDQNHPKVQVDHIEQLPLIYIARTESYPDKIRIRSDLLQGIAVPGSQLVYEPHLRITRKK